MVLCACIGYQYLRKGHTDLPHVADIFGASPLLNQKNLWQQRSRHDYTSRAANTVYYVNR